MKKLIDDEEYNVLIEASDWRYSSAVVGLVRFFRYLQSKGEEVKFLIKDDYIKYRKEDITLERYLDFVESYFPDEMHHRAIEYCLSKEELSDEDKKFINEKLKANSIMKNVFKGITFNGENKGEILKLINQNRNKLIENTFINGKKLHGNLNNASRLLDERGNICRLKGYYVDTGRKSKAIAYRWDTSTFVYEDELEFDFIPFGFSKVKSSGEVFFINNNFDVKALKATNDLFRDEEKNISLFEKIKIASDFIDYDVEVISKHISEDYFRTTFVRKPCINILKKISEYKVIKFFYKVNDNYTINFEKEVINRVLNLIHLDDLIEFLLKLKESETYRYRLKVLIEINSLIYGGDNMDKKMSAAYAAAKEVLKSKDISENKINSYKQKLLSAVIFKDKDRICQILLQLSEYSGVVFGFAYDVFENFDENKNVVYTFINALNKEKVVSSNE